jgi:hypothetical protein
VNGCAPCNRLAHAKPATVEPERSCSGRSAPCISGRNGHFREGTDSQPAVAFLSTKMGMSIGDFFEFSAPWNLQRRSCQRRRAGVEGNCSSKSCGGEVDSTGLRTQTAAITPRTRCVPPEALKNAATAKTKSAKTGGRQVPRFSFFLAGKSISRLAIYRTLFRRMAFPGKKWSLGGLSTVLAVTTLQNLLFSVLVFVFGFLLGLLSSRGILSGGSAGYEKGRG